MTRMQAEAQAKERQRTNPGRVHVAEMVSKEAGWTVKSYPLSSRV